MKKINNKIALNQKYETISLHEINNVIESLKEYKENKHELPTLRNEQEIRDFFNKD